MIFAARRSTPGQALLLALFAAALAPGCSSSPARVDAATDVNLVFVDGPAHDGRPPPREAGATDSRPSLEVPISDGRPTGDTLANDPCHDGEQNNGETDIDCGGPCGACDGASCDAPSECASGFCVGLVCVDACHNEIQEPTELDVDCGGDCGPCGPNQNCNTQADCEAGLFCNGTTCIAASSCAALQAATPGASLPSGPYMLLPTGEAAPVPGYCDFDTDGGGWTLVQRNVWQWQGQNALLNTGFTPWYEQTIGQVDQAYRLAGKFWSALAAGKEALFVLTMRKSGGSSCDPLYHKGTNVVLTADAANKTFTFASDAWSLMYWLTTVYTAQLSTLDSGPFQSNIVDLGILPWFTTGFGSCVTCPSIQSTMWTDAPHPSLLYFLLPAADLAGKTGEQACAPEGPLYGAGGTVWAGLNVLELYLR